MGNGFSVFGRDKVLVSLGAAALGLLGSVPQAQAMNQVIRTQEHVPGEVLVKLKSQSRVQAQSVVIQTLRRALGQEAVLSIHPLVTDAQVQNVRIANDSDLPRAIAALRQSDSVEVAEPNWVVHALESGVPTDPEFQKLWGLKNTGQADSAGQVGTVGADINVLPVWQQGHTGSRNILVAVIDTGIDWTHPDLKDNLWTNPGEVEGNGKDDDGNGFIDDIHGWNFFANTAASNDDHDHGSHCAGTIGASANNGQGVAGVNWNVSLLPVKFLSGSGSGSTEGAINSVNYARQMKVNVMSNSWGGGGFSQLLLDAIKAAKDQGILFVAAAGNDSSDNDALPSYPASYQLDNVLAVAATDNRDSIASFSNFGKTTVHVAAPGVKIFSTVKGGKYATFSGTSMATPHVAGIAALLMSADSTLTYADIKSRLIRTSTPVQGLKGKVVAKGRVNAYNALMNVVPPNDEPDESLWKDQVDTTESEHPYKNSADQTFTISSPGAKFMRVIFERVETERNYDKVSVQTAAGETVDEITGTVANYRSEYVRGDKILIKLKSDGSVNGWGFKVAKIQIIAAGPAIGSH